MVAAGLPVVSGVVTGVRVVADRVDRIGFVRFPSRGFRPAHLCPLPTLFDCITCA
ncbi:hypothetical protein I550_2207 [Mycobacterium intracellulare 1956]|uniref:Uncharacterized protein n=1 Tax=Mycobacterium intracellulare 1956 TaxID=1299331 RepID=X8CT79_MYCIT|nr:hypothetical protein I550_2207 [Mycobacterium intracellulare 1956]